jgi:hypothetical protein
LARGETLATPHAAVALKQRAPHYSTNAVVRSKHGHAALKGILVMNRLAQQGIG